MVILINGKWKSQLKTVEKLNVKNLDWILSYQSRVGPLKWIGPSTEHVIVENSKIKNILFVALSPLFLEHSETLVELDIEYKELADKNGCIEYIRVPALATNKNFIKSISLLVINKEENNLKACIHLKHNVLINLKNVLVYKMNSYLLFKSLHLIAVISWMAGLLYLPRIFVYHSENKNEIVTSVFKTMERKIVLFIMTPAMILSWFLA